MSRSPRRVTRPSPRSLVACDAYVSPALSPSASRCQPIPRWFASLASGAIPHWANSMQLEQAYFADAGYLERLGIEALPPVKFEKVIDWMSKARFNPILMRTLFQHLRIVTPRLFETVAADTIPLFVLEAQHACEIYGEEARELILDGPSATGKVLDIVTHPARYREVVTGIRANLAAHHSHAVRLKRLIEIIES